jgi:hypothetical protein
MSLNLLTVPNVYDLFANSITTNTTTDVPIVSEETLSELITITGGGTITGLNIRGNAQSLPPMLPVYVQTITGNGGAFQQNTIKIPRFFLTYSGAAPVSIVFSLPVNICPANGNTMASAAPLLDGGVTKIGAMQMVASGGIGAVQLILPTGSFSGPTVGTLNDITWVYDPLL